MFRITLLAPTLLLAILAGCSSGNVGGTGSTPATTALAVSTNALSFTGTVGTTIAAQTVTLTNSGTTAITFTNFGLSGTNATSFTAKNTCPATLAAAATCTVTATFSPAAAGTFSAALTLGSNAATQTVTLAGTATGTTTTGNVTRTLYTEPDQGMTFAYNLINAATKTIDMTMYELVDTTFSADLVAACQRGVKVRIILDQNLELSNNAAAYAQLNAQANCSAVYANPAFQASHEKSILIDGVTSVIMSLNLTSRYYTTTRDFALVENDPADYAAIEATFNADYGSTTSYSYVPGLGTDLIWSPTTAQTALLAVINGSTKTLLVENEEMGAANIVSALQAACQRGVQVHITLTDTGSYHANFSALEASGCGVHVYPNTTTGLYIHAKAMVADYGLTTQSVYMGFINFSIASMTQNRELGLYLTDPTAVATLNSTLTSDYAGAPAY